MSPNVHLVTMDSNADFSTQTLRQYKDVFNDELRKLPVMYSMTMDSNTQPVVRPAHRIPVAMQDRVKAELNRMQSIGVITPVTEPTDWVSSMVVAHKKNKHEIRLCLNQCLGQPYSLPWMPRTPSGRFVSTGNLR